jgi:phage terminase large subunit-like protein
MASRNSTAPADPFADCEAPSFNTYGPHAARVIQAHCTHAKGEWFGQPLKLEPWQKWLLNEMFRSDPKTGLRYWRQALVMVPRKNAKSTLVAALGYLFLVFDDEGGPEVYSAAWGEQQARNVFDAARTMWDASPALRKRTRKFARAITCPANAGAWRVVSRLAELQQGTNPHAALIDEYHVHQRSDLYDAFKRGTQARRQPMTAIITTEGSHRQTPLGEMQRGFLQIGEVEEVTPYLRVVRDHGSRSLMIRWGLTDEQRDVDIENPDVVRGCNPAGWLDAERLISEYLHAPGSRESEFRRYHLNQLWQEDGDGLDAKVWDALARAESPLEPGQAVVLGVDVGLRDDHSAILAMGRTTDGGLHAEATILRPPAELDRELDYDDIIEAVEAFARKYRVKCVVADPFLAGQLMQDWSKRGMPVREFRFQPTQIGPASQFLLEQVERGSLTHDGGRDLREHVLNMRMKERGSWWRWDKPADKSMKIDAGMALCMAASEFMDGDVYSLADGLAIV